MNEQIEALKQLQAKVDAINDKATRIENRLTYQSSLLDRLSRQLTDLTTRGTK